MYHASQVVYRRWVGWAHPWVSPPIVVTLCPTLVGGDSWPCCGRANWLNLNPWEPAIHLN